MNNELNQNFQAEEGNSLKDYIKLIRSYLLPISLIAGTALIVSIVYALTAVDIYQASSALKISKPQAGGILSSPLIPGFSDFGSDRFIANEMEILKSRSIREKVTQTLIDTFKAVNNRSKFYMILDKSFSIDQDTSELLDKNSMVEMLGKKVKIDQKRGIDFVDITFESPSPFEAQLVVNVYANAYKKLNLTLNRQQLVTVREFLNKQKKEKFNELIKAEDKLKNYQLKGGIVSLPEQAQALVDQLTDFQSKRDAAKIELTISEQSLKKLKDELKKRNPRLQEYLDGLALDSYITALSEQLALLQTQKDKAIVSGNNSINKDKVIKNANRQIDDLKAKLNAEIKRKGATLLAATPDEIRELTKQIFEGEVKHQSSLASYNALKKITHEYESKFNLLPDITIELARYEREQQAFEKLYLLIEEKYQEALINEKSIPGDVIIVDPAITPYKPAKPNRILIVIIGLVLGLGIGFGYAFTKDFFDNTVKTPEDLQKRNINVLTWIPQFNFGAQNKEFEFIVAKKSDSIPSEAFRALRTRIQFSKIEKDAIKSILVTSSTPKEGKTTVSVNLAGSFALADRKTIIVDCDLRKPRMHKVFNVNRFPGFIDYFFGKAEFNEIVHKSEIKNLSFITAGTIPPNPAEILSSRQMEEFLVRLKKEYDLIILDSPPVIAVTDSEILSSLVDATLLVVSADQTEIELMEKAAELLSKQHHGTFLGAVLNNFSYKSGYGSYYKYYYYYSHNNDGKQKGKLKA